MLRDGTVAVVVGSGAGIGREIALRMGAEGADVVLAGRSVEPMDEVADLLRDRGRRALVVPADLRDPDAVAALADRAVDEFGRVDALVVNSGVAGPTRPLTEIDLDDWQDTFAVNVTGVFLCCRAFLARDVPGRVRLGRGDRLGHRQASPAGPDPLRGVEDGAGRARAHRGGGGRTARSASTSCRRAVSRGRGWTG